MGNKDWQLIFEVKRHRRVLLFGHQLEYYRWALGWPNIKLTVFFWHRTYKLWLYKLGED